MSNEAKASGTRNVSLSAEECAEVLTLLESALGDTRVEVHHTHTPDFREKVQHREQTLRNLIEKFRHAGG
jgi:hypothetical protein